HWCRPNVYRRSLVSRVPPGARGLRSRKRPARTPPSTFLFLPIHLSNNPGTLTGPRPPARRRNRRSSQHPTFIGGLFTGISEELRRRSLTPRRRRAVGAVYRLQCLTLSTPARAENPRGTACRACGRDASPTAALFGYGMRYLHDRAPSPH